MAEALSVAQRGAGPFVRRFSTLERWIHGFVIISFLGLVMTGVPLRFAGAPWAGTLVRFFGGVQGAGIIHRICAVITFGYFFTHLGSLAIRIARSPNKLSYFWGPDSMVPQLKDVRDVIGMFKWFFGLGSRPKFDRFSYMEKFDYWAVFWGIAIIGGSGLLLWFPVLFAKALPGWAFNIATIVHGDEALLALSFIFTIHFFNVHFRPEKFPIDTVIFTGRATAEYMKEEHPLQYERLDPQDLEGMIETPPSATLTAWSIVLGFAALGVGVVLIVLVVWALLQ